MWELLVEEEVHNVSPGGAPNLVFHLVDVTCTIAHDPSHEPMLTTIDSQAPDDSWMGCMFGMAEL